MEITEHASLLQAFEMSQALCHENCHDSSEEEYVVLKEGITENEGDGNQLFFVLSVRLFSSR